MRNWKKFWAVFFLAATSTIFIPTVYAGGDFSAENPNDSGSQSSISIPKISNPQNKKPDNSNKKNDEENFTPSDEFSQDENAFELPKDEDKNSGENIAPSNEILIPSDIKRSESDEKLNTENDGEETFLDEDSDLSKDTGIVGDINGDRELNALDLIILQKYLKGKVFEINENAADIDGSGNISLFDVHALLNLIKAEKKGTGDINNDGKINIYDVQALTAYLANSKSTPINSENADLNGDGKISTDDLKILRKVIAELQE